MDKKLTPMMRQYMEIKEQYKDFILFYRLGDFYEMFYEDAQIASRVLDITLTKRGSSKEDAPLCGVPFHSVEPYIAKMVRNGYKVAICEQTEDPKQSKGIVKREVVRLITPGTISDLEMLEEDEHSYLCCLYFGKKEYKSQFDLLDLIEDRVKDYTNLNLNKNCYCLSYADISLGSMRVCELEERNRLYQTLYKLRPKEVILPAFGLKGNYNSDDLNISNYDEVLQILSDEDLIEIYKFLYDLSTTITWKDISYFARDSAEERIKRILNLYNLNSMDIHSNHCMICACGSLFSYIEETQKMYLSHFNAISVDHGDSNMVLDHFTRANLELTQALRRDNNKGTLYWVLNKTDSAMGSRMLKDWIQNPLLHPEDIIKRQNLVEALYENPISRANLKKYISQIYDFERLISKVVYKSINPKDFIALKLSIKSLPLIRRALNEIELPCIEEYLRDFDDLTEVHEILEHALLDDAPFSIREGGIFKSGYHELLDELRDISEHGNDKLAQYEAKEKENTGIKNLKVSFNRVFGYYIEISKGNVKNVPDYYIRKQTLVNAERYITPELKAIEDKVLNAQEKMKALEGELYEELKEQMLEYVSKIRHMAMKMAFIDAINSLAEVAEKNRYVKPQLEEASHLEILGGRHPVVEQISDSQSFIPNDVYLDNADGKEFLMIVTGPNMAGKSTYLRQIALICIMAQIGSYVPADFARLGIVDRVFTRVGASDDLFSAQSTFMVEMNELASILNNATSKSLIILDEIGRGTSTYDGLSIAWAVVEHIATQIRAKTLFATHYHELTELENLIEGVCNYYISVVEKNDEIAFLRKIERGGVNKSLGIQVAKLAGVNQNIIDRAKELLKKLEEKDIVHNSMSLKSVEYLENQQEEQVESAVLGELQEKIKRLEVQNSALKRELGECRKKSQFADAVLNFDLDRHAPFDFAYYVRKLKEDMS